MERGSASLTIRETQIKTTRYTVVYTLTSRLSKTKQKPGNSKNRPIPRTKQKTKSTGEDAEKRALYTADVNAKRRSCNGKQYGRSLQKN